MYLLLIWMFPLHINSIYANLLSTSQGTINGTTLTSRNGRTVNAYFNIPFAKPPGRFESAVEAGPWEGVRDGTELAVPCIQKKTTGDEIIGSEDCLYLNVYTPLNTQKGDNLSVLFYVYGGMYKYSGNLYNSPMYYMDQDIIFVLANFRKGVLGFLSTGDTTISGNFALKDQTLALRWVQKYIYEYGGNPNKVTVNGHSSGAVNVHLHTLSPMSKGLFQQVILQSGTSYCSLGFWDKQVARSITKELARLLNCSTESSEVMLRCFMGLDASALILGSEQLYVWDSEPNGIFRPSVEDKNVPDAFFTDVPQKLEYQEKDLPWLIGLTTGEGAFKTATYLDVTKNGEPAMEINDHFKTLFPITLQYLWHTKAKHMDYASQMLRTYYFQDQEFGTSTRYQMTQLYTQGLFGICVLDAIHLYEGPKHVYWYNYRSNYSSQNNEGYYPEILGVSHGDEVHLLLYHIRSAPYLTDADVMFSQEMIKRWVNFVNSGDPNKPESINETMMGYWEPMMSKNIEYLKIEVNGSMENGLYKRWYPFWKSLPLNSKYFN